MTCGLVTRRLLQVKAEQIAGIMEGELAGEGGPAASTITAAADSARMWNAGKGGAYWAPGVLLHLMSLAYITLTKSALKRGRYTMSLVMKVPLFLCAVALPVYVPTVLMLASSITIECHAMAFRYTRAFAAPVMH